MEAVGGRVGRGHRMCGVCKGGMEAVWWRRGGGVVQRLRGSELLLAVCGLLPHQPSLLAARRHLGRGLAQRSLQPRLARLLEQWGNVG